MILNNIPDVSLQTVTVNRQPGVPGETDRVTAFVDASFVQSTLRIEDQNNRDFGIGGYNIRIVATYDKDTANRLDYLTALQNEYLLAQTLNSQVITQMPAGTYVRSLRRSLREFLPPRIVPPEENPAHLTYMTTNPASPFSAWYLQGMNIGATYSVSDPSLAPNTIIWDRTLESLLPQDRDGNIINRDIQATSVGRTRRPEGQGRTTDVIISNVDYGNAEEETEIAQQLENRRTRHLLSRVNIPRIELDLTDSLNLSPGDSIDQLTFYVFIYNSPMGLARQQQEVAMGITVGSSMIQSATLFGEKRFWPPLGILRGVQTNQPVYPVNAAYLDSYLVNSTTQEAPDAYILQLIEYEDLGNVRARTQSLFDKIYRNFLPLYFDQNPILKKSIGVNNSFTELWFSKDSDENLRMVFGVDLVAYLAATSYFPFVYENSSLASQLINGTGFMMEEEPSKIQNVKIRRKIYKKEGHIGDNQLGTVGREFPKHPSIVYPQVYLDTVDKVNINLVAGPTTVKNKFCFYESKDEFKDYTNAFTQGTAAYECEAIVTDAAPFLIRKVVSILSEEQNKVQEVFDNIVNSVPRIGPPPLGPVRDGRGLWNPRSRILAVPIGQIQNARGVSYRKIILRAAAKAQMILNEFVPTVQDGPTNLVDLMEIKLDVNNGLIDPEEILELEKLISFTLMFFMKKLTQIWPNNPLGLKNVSGRDNLFQSRGLDDRRFPIYKLSHLFDEKYYLGKNKELGCDYMMVSEGNEEGVTRFSLDQYFDRVQSEFRKYFSPQQANGDLNPNLGSYNDPSFQYFTPLVVRTPTDTQHSEIMQTDPGNFPLNSPRSYYDLDTYAKTFADIVQLNIEGKYLNIKNPRIYNAPNTNQNKSLYDSLKHSLWQEYSTQIFEKTEKQFEEPRESTTEPGVTTIGGYSPNRINFTGPQVIPTIAGGASSVGGSAYTYIGQADAQFILSPSSATGGLFVGSSPKGDTRKQPQPSLPIKLPFAIFGEMSIDAVFNPDEIYQKEQFNSLTSLAFSAATPNNIVEVVQTQLGNLPNQTKSLMVLATTDDDVTLGDPGNLNFSFSARRPILRDEDLSPIEDQMISYYKTGENIPPFHKTEDPMKIYAKFMTFWMNYKNIFIVECLSGFENLQYKSPITRTEADQVGMERNLDTPDSQFLNKAKLPNWVPISSDLVSALRKRDDKVLCRLRRLSPLDMLPILEPLGGGALKASQFFNSEKPINLETYNKYFLLTNERTPEPFSPAFIPGIENEDFSPGPLPFISQTFVPQVEIPNPVPPPVTTVAVFTSNQSQSEDQEGESQGSSGSNFGISSTNY